MPPSIPAEIDGSLPPFDHFKGIQPLGTERRGGASAEHARHLLFSAHDKRTRTGALIKVTARPGLVYQQNLDNEIASLATINRELPDVRYFPLLKEHGSLSDGRAYLITSLFDELPLATTIGVDRMPARMASYLRTVMEVARALITLHRLDIFHVDLNPMNILQRIERGAPVIRIVDFESSYERARHASGVFYNPPTTQGYSAPELGRESPDARADLYSLGAVFYTMIAGYAATWEAEIEKCVAADKELEPELKTILLGAVDTQPANRYRSVLEFRTLLAGYLNRVWDERGNRTALGRPPVAGQVEKHRRRKDD